MNSLTKRIISPSVKGQKMLFATRYQVVIYIIFCLCNLLPISLFAQKDYFPKRRDPLKEQWSWQFLEVFNGKYISCIAPTKRNHLWVGFQKGQLGYYDGHTLRVEDLANENSINQIFDVFVNTLDDPYLSTDKGLFARIGNEWVQITGYSSPRQQVHSIFELCDQTLIYAHKTGLIRIKDNQIIQELEIEGGVVSIAEGPNQMLWILTGTNGIIYETHLKNGRIPPVSSWNKIHESSELIESFGNLLVDDAGQLWYVNTSSKDEIQQYDPSRAIWIRHNLESSGGENYCTDILKTRDGVVWIAGRANLSAFKNGQWLLYKSPEYTHLSGELSLDQDHNGYLYILDSKASIFRIDYEGKTWNSYDELHFQDESLDGKRWYITYSGHVVCEDTKTGHWVEYDSDDNIIRVPQSLFVTSEGDVFLIGQDQGHAAVSIFDGEKWITFSHPQFASTIARTAFTETSDGDVFLGGAIDDNHRKTDWNGGLLRYYKKDGDYHYENYLPGKLPLRNSSLTTTPDDTIWTVSNDIHSINREGKVESHAPVSPNRFWIDQIAADQQGNLWTVVWGNGIFRLGTDNMWQEFDENQGLGTKFISYLMHLHDGTSIVATNEGFYRYDGKQWIHCLHDSLKMYREAGTLRASEDGSIWINYTYIDWYYRWRGNTSDTKANRRHFYTVQYSPDEQPPQTTIRNEQDKTMTDNRCRVEWKATDAWSNTPREKIQYSWRLNHGEWSNFSYNQFVELKNIKDDRYLFEVRSRDTDLNIETNPAELRFTINLPFWRHTWFYIFTAILTFCFLILIAYTIRLKIKHIVELDTLRFRFFTNISHELRTPLTLMLIPLEKLMDSGLNSTNKAYLASLRTHVNRLSVLVDQLLDFRKVEMKKFETNPRKIELISFCKNLVSAFEIQSQDRQHQLNFNTSHHSCLTLIDPDLLQKIIDNLIHNAIKYTPDGGTIEVNLKIEANGPLQDSPTFQLTVEDDGEGIGSKELDKIFEPFYRENKDLSSKGTGIGLALVKEIVELLQGEIKTESPINVSNQSRPGTRFTIRIPLPTAIQLTETQEEADGNDSHSFIEANRVDNHVHTTDESKPLILVIEDNLEIRQHLVADLSANYEMISAENGTQGLLLAKSEIPNLIISDVMMPEMDGFELSQKLKDDINTSHIPLLLLTALKSDEHKEKGFKSGVDDYLEKPFSMRLLHLKIKNLLQTRQRLSEHIRKKYDLLPVTPNINALDDKFIQKASVVVEDHLDDCDFSVDQFAKTLGMSRSAIYRKFEAIAGISPSTFLKKQRLKSAAKMLLEGELNITEIAFSVGYTDSANFSRSFKEHFGCIPSKYREDKLKEMNKNSGK